MTLKASDGYFTLLLVVYKLLLDVAYVEFVATLFAYQGFKYNLDPVKQIEAWVLFLLLIFWVPKKVTQPSDFLIFIFFIVTLAPLITYYGLADQDRTFLYMAVLVFFIMKIVIAGPVLKVPFIRNGNTVTLYLSALFISLTFIKLVISGNIFSLNFDFNKIYEHRDNFGDVFSTGLWGYVIAWTTKVFMIFVFVNALVKKKYILAVSVLLLQIIIFGAINHKAVLFYPFLAVALFCLRNSKHIILYCLLFLTSLLIASFMAYILFDVLLLSSLFIRRVFFLPAYISFSYFEYFSVNGHVYLSHGILSSFISYPFNAQPAELIGAMTFGSTDTHANTGFVATSFMNFGYFGMIFFGFILSLCMRFIDNFAKGDKPIWYFLALVIVPFFTIFLSSELLTGILTHGLGITLLILWFSHNKVDTKNESCNEK